MGEVEKKNHTFIVLIVGIWNSLAVADTERFRPGEPAPQGLVKCPAFCLELTHVIDGAS